MDPEKLLARAAECGGPIVEAIKDTNRSKVTFVWSGKPDTKSVTVQTQLVWMPEILKMRRLPNSDVWTSSHEVDNDVTTAYQFVVDYAAPPAKKLIKLSIEEQ